MLFNSIEFLVYLPIVFTLYWFVFQRNLRAQNLLVVVVSYVFYGWWSWHFLLLIAFTSLCSYLSGIAISHAKSSTEKTTINQSSLTLNQPFGGGKLGTKKVKTLNKGKFYCSLNIIINLGILGVYKYFNFFAESFATAFACLGIEVHPTTLNLVLPVGISFYTFQALSYTIDVYRGKLEATHDIVSFFAFISFFPQLVAGPIERATNLLPQFHKSRIFDYTTAVDGTRQILWGLFKKIVIADNCADYVDKVWADYTAFNTSTLILASVMFSFQIYGDFSGYSDIAIGTAKLFGIRLMRNFNVPYFSRDIAEFWRRWHISLNTWFVDYIYIPLGGSRCGKAKVFLNTIIVFLISGLWHGANWTFVCWGVFHAFCFLPLLLLGKNRRFRDTVAESHLLPSWCDALRILSTFALVTFGWIIFRAENIGQCVDYIACIFTTAGTQMIDGGGKKQLAFIALMLLIEWINRVKPHPFQLSIANRTLRWAVYMAVAILCLTYAGHQAEFIYFQF